MASRLYVTEADIATERDVVDTFTRMGFQSTHHLDKSANRWDITLHLPVLDIPVEAKRRKMPHIGTYDEGVFLDVAKVHDLLADYPVMLFVVVPNDLTQHRAWITPDDVVHLDIDSRDVRPERGDINDKGDHKYLVPVHWFRRIA